MASSTTDEDKVAGPVGDVSFARPDVQTCPFPIYERLFASGTRAFLDPLTGFWEVVRYSDLMTITQNPALYSSEHMLYGEKTHAVAYAEMKELYETQGYPSLPTLINADDPVHRRNREIVDLSFKPSRVKLLEDYIRELVTMLVDRWADRGECELMSEFAVLLPVYVISDTIGVSRERALDIKRWSDALIGVHDPSLDGEGQIRLTREIIEMQQFLAAEYERARQAPGENILGDIARAEIDGEPVSTQLAVHMVSGLLVAGNETTTSVLGSAMKRLIATSGMEERLRSEPGRIPDFIEEVLRLESPLPCQFRRNTEDVQIGEAAIPKDSLVVVRFGAANRDPERFDDPNTVDIDRPRIKQHLAFGAGIHMCIGHLLARAELRIAYEELLKRFRNFTLAGEPTTIPSYIAYGPRSVPIRFEPA